MGKSTNSDREVPGLPARNARSAEDILRDRHRRVLLVAGLAGLAVLALVMAAVIGTSM